MGRDWVVAVNLGSFAMIGVALAFVVLWVIDRSRLQALYFAGAIGCYFAGTAVLSAPLDIAFVASVHGVLLPICALLLAGGLLRRIGERIGPACAVAVLLGMAAPVWYFAYISPVMIGRIVTQSLGMGLVLSYAVVRLHAHSARRTSDRVTMAVVAALATSLLCNVVLALAAVSEFPSELETDAHVADYLSSALEKGILLSSAVLLPSVMIVLLAVTLSDTVADLRTQRDCDELTGLLNRRGFTERAHRALSRAPASALVLADLDFFKEVNDALGHAGGDHALVMFARVLCTEPKPGRIAGRIGGEEFAVLLPAANSDTALAFAESVRSRLAARSVTYGGVSAPVTASFGVAATATGTTLPMLLDAADRALYVAKANGRNCTAVRD